MNVASTKEADETRMDGVPESGNSEEATARKLTKEEKKALYKPPAPPEPYCTWRKILKDIWVSVETKETRLELIKEVLDNIFDTADNPYEVTLGIHRVCPDFGAQKSASLAGLVIRRARTWFQENNRIKKYSHLLTLDCKMEAFSLAVVKGTVHLEVIAEVFELVCEETIEHVYEKVQEMLESNNIRDAIVCATTFGLQSRFTLENLVIPAVLQDRMPLVEAYISGNRELQTELVRYFDSLIGLNDYEIELHFEELKKKRIMTIPITKIQGKTLEKMVFKMASSFGLSFDVTPRLARSRHENSLRHMVFKHFVEQAATEEAYIDYVTHALTNDPDLQCFFVKYLVQVCRRPEEAVRWVVHFEMFERAPACVRPYLTEPYVLEAQDSLARLATTKRRLSDNFLFPGHPIIVVDTVEDLRLVGDLVSSAAVVGIDTEWKPTFLSLNEQIALIQVSVRDRSYLIDMLELEKIVLTDEWSIFFEKLLCSEKAIKLGFDFANDLRVLASSFPLIESLKTTNVICLMRLVKSLLSENPSLLPLGTKEKLRFEAEEHEQPQLEEIHFRLTDLCEVVLGAPLDKSEQFGNWAMRPLRAEQMRYAAMDAYCLVEIYDVLKKLAVRENLDWGAHMAKGDMTYIKPKEPKKPKCKTTKVDEDDFKEMIERVNKSIRSSNSRKPQDLKVVVDSMMLGLGKHLRRCGVDTVLAESRSYLIECALREPDRYILTTGKAVDELMRNRSLRTTGRIVRLPTPQSMSAIQLLECVLKYFNLHFTEGDIFSRCMSCNAASFVKAPAPVLEAMYQANVHLLNPFHDAPYDAEKYNEKMLKIDPELYGGYKCEVSVHSDDKTWTTVKCCNGILDVKNCFVQPSNSSKLQTVHVEKIPPQAFEKEGRLFYVCSECGKVYWDGCHRVNYNMFADSLLEADDSF